MITKIVTYCEKIQISFYEWVFSILAVTFVRGFFENFSGRDEFDIFSTDTETFVHYTLFYFFTITTLLIIVHFFAKKNIINTAKVFLFGSLLVWLPPCIDFVVTKGKGVFLTYLFTTKDFLVKGYISFIFGNIAGMSLGIKIEFILLFTLVFLYVYTTTKNTIRSVLAVISVYTLLFSLFALPTLLGVIPSFEWMVLFTQSLLGKNFFHPTIHFLTLKRSFEMYFNIIISQVFYIGLIINTVTIAYRWNHIKTLAILKNSRIERVMHYFFMITLGIILAMISNGDSTFLTGWFDITTLCILFFSFYSVWMFSVCMNDIVDIACDSISNNKRPLVTGVLTKEDMKIASFTFLSFALLGGYIVGHYPFYMILVFVALSHIYTFPPLRLKRFVIVNSFIIALAGLTAMIAGFFTVSNSPYIHSLPLNWVILILVVYMLFANIKDIKDIEGDRAVGVYTIPVLFGLERGKIIIAFFISIALFLIPLLSHNALLWYLFLPFSGISYYLLTKKEFKEKEMFVTYFIYLMVAACLSILYF